MSTEVAALAARVRAALRLLGNDDITPAGRRVLERILDEAESLTSEIPVVTRNRSGGGEAPGAEVPVRGRTGP